MKMNTLVNYPMSVEYRSWEPYHDKTLSLTFRNYSTTPETINCILQVSPIGAITLYSREKLQLFCIIKDIKDAGGEVVMEDEWYTVTKVTPVFDGGGYLTSYKHNIAYMAPEFVEQPIEPLVFYPDIDQQQWG